MRSFAFPSPRTAQAYARKAGLWILLIRCSSGPIHFPVAISQPSSCFKGTMTNFKTVRLYLVFYIALSAIFIGALLFFASPDHRSEPVELRQYSESIASATAESAILRKSLLGFDKNLDRLYRAVTGHGLGQESSSEFPIPPGADVFTRSIIEEANERLQKAERNTEQLLLMTFGLHQQMAQLDDRLKEASDRFNQVRSTYQSGKSWFEIFVLVAGVICTAVTLILSIRRHGYEVKELQLKIVDLQKKVTAN